MPNFGAALARPAQHTVSGNGLWAPAQARLWCAEERSAAGCTPAEGQACFNI